MNRFALTLLFALAVALFAVPESASAAGTYVSGQPVRNVVRFVTGTNRRAVRRAEGRALFNGNGAFVKGQPLRNLGRAILGTNRRAGRSCR